MPCFRIEKPQDKEAVAEYLGRLPEGRRYDVTIKVHRERRSMDQNRLLWLWLGCISAETGQDRNDLHDFFKEKFLGVETRQVLGKTLTRPRSTTSLDTAQFTGYLERIQAFAGAELGIVLPNPEDRFWEQFYQQYKDFI